MDSKFTGETYEEEGAKRVRRMILGFSIFGAVFSAACMLIYFGIAGLIMIVTCIAVAAICMRRTGDRKGRS